MQFKKIEQEKSLIGNDPWLLLLWFPLPKTGNQVRILQIFLYSPTFYIANGAHNRSCSELCSFIICLTGGRTLMVWVFNH